MPESRVSQLAGPVPGICPHLGVPEDTQTCLAYPSRWNVCHRAGLASAVDLDHQRQACLSSTYAACPVYKRGRVGRLPARFRALQLQAGPRRAIWLFVLLLLLGAIFWAVSVTLP